MEYKGKGTDSGVRSLDADYYTNPEIFDKENHLLLAHTWQFAGHVTQIPAAGDYFIFEIAGESLICIRDVTMQIRVFYNVCQHRAHQLLGGSGNVSSIVCPYHAWRYSLSGQLRGGPNIDSVVGFDKSTICLSSALVEDFCGFIFVNLDVDAQPMDDWYPGVRQELVEFVPHIDRLTPLKWVEIPENCNWKVSVENYSECYHCQLNHPTFAKGVVKPNTYNIEPQGYCLRHTTECQNLDKMTYPIDIEANARAGDYSSWFLWPLFSFQVYPGNILNTYHWRPTAYNQVTVWRGWYSQQEADKPLINQLAKQDRQTTVEEDIGLVESVQRGLQSRGYRPGPLVIDPERGVRSEHSIQVLQGWMREGIMQQ